MSMEFGLLLQLNAILSRLSHVYFYTVYSKRIYPSFSCHLRLHNWQQEIKWYVTWVTKRKSMMRHTKKEKKATNLVTHKKNELFWSFVFKTQFTFELSLQFLFITYPAVMAFIDTTMHGFFVSDLFIETLIHSQETTASVLLIGITYSNDSPVFISAVVLVIRW